MSNSNGPHKINILFVCMGNICRSPMAEAVFRKLVEQEGVADHFEIASAGTGDWHVGQLPHRGTRETLKRHGIEPNGLSAKQISQTMLDRADYVVAMDDENISDLRSWRIDRKKVSRILDYAEGLDVHDVPDPYYDDRFELVYQLVSLGSAGLLRSIREGHLF